MTEIVHCITTLWQAARSHLIAFHGRKITRFSQPVLSLSTLCRFRAEPAGSQGKPLGLREQGSGNTYSGRTALSMCVKEEWGLYSPTLRVLVRLGNPLCQQILHYPDEREEGLSAGWVRKRASRRTALKRHLPVVTAAQVWL